MLGKLLKHEWKSTWKAGGMMLLGVVLVSFFGWLSFQAPMWRSIANDSYYTRFSMWDLVSVGTLFMYIIMLIGLNYGILIYMGVHFYRTMYTDEGYLTHTLPVSKHQILASKILNSGLWYLLMELGVFLSVFLLMFSMIGAFLPEGYTWADMWETIEPEMGYVNEAFRDIFGMSAGGYFGMVLAVSLISPFCTMIILFGAISMGQLFTKHRVLMAIVSYVGIMIVANIISSVIRSFFSVNRMMSYTFDNAMAGSYVNTTMWISVVLSIMEAVILYFVSYYVTSRKLNME
ncbi:MAG: hypothetical protein NC420_09835 [Eubacterium sp.]|nr:hypothetical protein [Eubacterium sp.]MCM1216295.1 hypothetical protein [Lachnospiraceae bacterium]MCM1303806.1 hypothetical protein [Butyrivibrio sp.]MCM1342848.1 hypothetical protein [Muribaculaceae bacterium]MCM1240062.1 hypothetical protein [Lachnospiraceae bacterium]